jgi:hypothetical protein
MMLAATISHTPAAWVAQPTMALPAPAYGVGSASSAPPLLTDLEIPKPGQWAGPHRVFIDMRGDTGGYVWGVVSATTRWCPGATIPKPPFL